MPLRNLKTLSLEGEFRHLFGLLRQLILPEALDEVYLSGLKSTVHDVPQTLAPYMRDYFRRDTRFRNRLEISPSFSTHSILVSVDVVCTQTTAPVQKQPRVTFGVILASPPPDVLKRFFIDFITPLPREHIVSLKDRRNKKLPEELFFMMPNIETLRIHCVRLSEGFLRPNPDGLHANAKLLPSLRSLSLEGVNLNDNNLGHLTKYLAHRTSDNQTISLEVRGYSRYSRQKVANEVKGLVEEFTLYLKPVGRAWRDQVDWFRPV